MHDNLHKRTKFPYKRYKSRVINVQIDTFAVFNNGFMLTKSITGFFSRDFVNNHLLHFSIHRMKLSFHKTLKRFFFLYHYIQQFPFYMI